MFVDREGMHCILLAEHELFYCNWEDNHIYQINTMGQEGTTRPRAFRSVDIYHDAGEQNFFEILLGTQDGQIYHAALEYSNAGLDVAEHFTSVIEIPDAKAILDLKIASMSMY